MATGGIGDTWLPSSLEAAKIPSLPPTAYYLPNFISEQEERLILDKVRLLCLEINVDAAASLMACVLDCRRASTAMEAAHASTPADLAVGSRSRQAARCAAACLARDTRGAASAVAAAVQQ